VTPDFAAQARAWSSPPVDHLNSYIPAQTLLDMPAEEFAHAIDLMAAERYGGWRNHDGLWTGLFHADVAGKRILDYGCGVGLEARHLAMAGATVDLADISEVNLRLAARTLGIDPRLAVGSAMYPIRRDPPFTAAPPGDYDIFYCNGVLHHIWYPVDVMQYAWQLLRPHGEARLMLYSDEGWRLHVGTEPPADTASDPNFRHFVQTFDQVGSYADWYSADKIRDWFGHLFELERFEYLTPYRQYCAAILRRKEGL